MQTFSSRLNSIPPYIFAELDNKKKELTAKGVDLIHLGVGDPDLPPPPRMIEALKEALNETEYHRYPEYEGEASFKEAVANWLNAHHNIQASLENELLVLIGSKEGLSHLPSAIINPGDTVLITDPCFPAQYHSILLAEGKVHFVPIEEKNGFLPDLKSIPEKVLKNTKLFFINYPNNPTTAIATKDFFEEMIYLARKYSFAICHDAAYIDINLQGTKQPALMSIKGAKEVAIEFFSFSKMFNICGWRLGACVGNNKLVESLVKYKKVIDSGPFTALQQATVVGLRECLPFIGETMSIYRERKKILCNCLESMGLDYYKSDSTFYIWAKIPNGSTSKDFSNRLLTEHGIITTPGIGFGPHGENHIRFSLTTPTERIKEAVYRLKRAV